MFPGVEVTATLCEYLFLEVTKYISHVRYNGWLENLIVLPTWQTRQMPNTTSDEPN